MILVPTNKVEKIKYFSTLFGLIFIEITRGPFKWSGLRGVSTQKLWKILRSIPGKVKLLLISGKKSASLLDHISRFLSHQFVTWYVRSISKTKIVKLFCPCMNEHMIYIKNVTNVTQTLQQNVTNVTKQNIASKEILTIEFHTFFGHKRDSGMGLACLNFLIITVTYIKVYISGMEMSQRIRFWYQILQKMLIFLRKWQKITFLVKQFCDKLIKNNFELKMLKLLENHVKTLL